MSIKSIFVPILRESAFLLGLWRPKVDRALEEAVNRFAAVNAALWKPVGRSAQAVLVEGHLCEYGPNYLFRTALAAKSVQSALGGARLDVVVNGFSYHWQQARKGYASFGITQWIFLGRRFLLLSPLLWMTALLGGGWRFILLRTPEQILDLHLGGIKVGDLIYDEVMRSTKQPTIRFVDWAVLKVMVRSWYYFLQYHLLFSVRSYSYYIATHTAYPEYGLLCRVALQRGVTVIETSDIQMSVFRGIGTNYLPTYHQGIHSAIRAEFDRNAVPLPQREALALESLRRRINSELDQIDAKKAYSGKIYTREDLASALRIPVDSRIGFVMAHVFVDSPHLSSSMLHADYYRWLVATLDCCAEASNVIWVVKPHPSAALYGEEGMVNDLVQAKGAANVHICPSDLNTRSLGKCADLMLTVHGTAGLEYACVGIPVVLAGTPFFAGFGFTLEPQTQEAYRQTVLHAAEISSLTPSQVSMALQVFEIWERQFDWNNSIITSELLACVWGNGVKRDLSHAYTLLTNKLAMTDPRSLKLWGFAGAVVREDAARA